MKFLSAISIIASVVYLYVGINSYKLSKKSKECCVFLVLNASMAIWSFAYSFAYTAENNTVFYFWSKISSMGWCTFPALSLFFVLTITNNKYMKHLMVKIVIILPAFAFLYMSIFLFGPTIKTNEFVSDLFYYGNFAYNFFYLLLCIIILLYWGLKSEYYNQKKQSQIIVITSIIPFMLTLITQTIPPVFDMPVVSLGHIFSLIMMGGVSYTIINYQFMQIPSTLITRELFNEIKDLTILIDLNGTVVKTNKQVHKLLYYEEEELINTPITSVIQAEAFVNWINKGQSINKQVELSNIEVFPKTGEPILFDISITPLFDQKRKILHGIMIVGQDIRIIRNLQTEIASHKNTSEKLKKSEELFRTMIELLPFAIIQTSIKDDTVIYVNNHME